MAMSSMDNQRSSPSPSPSDRIAADQKSGAADKTTTSAIADRTAAVGNPLGRLALRPSDMRRTPGGEATTSASSFRSNSSRKPCNSCTKWPSSTATGARNVLCSDAPSTLTGPVGGNGGAEGSRSVPPEAGAKAPTVHRDASQKALQKCKKWTTPSLHTGAPSSRMKGASPPADRWPAVPRSVATRRASASVLPPPRAWRASAPARTCGARLGNLAAKRSRGTA
mmetsp:Transcript_39682/g.114160  ORF Transcript_39682/g.114160 Transcript_39682/m.114160 type:complete len:224 (+) Transcript_39682:1352-2023(+)